METNPISERSGGGEDWLLKGEISGSVVELKGSIREDRGGTLQEWKQWRTGCSSVVLEMLTESCRLSWAIEAPHCDL